MDVEALKKRLRKLADEMERHLGPPEMAPGPDPDDLTDAADVLDALKRERDHWEAYGNKAHDEAEAAEARVVELERERDAYDAEWRESLSKESARAEHHKARAAALAAENERLRDALQIFADDENWRYGRLRRDRDCPHHTGERSQAMKSLLVIKGTRAEAEAEAARRGIDFEVVHRSAGWNETFGYSSAPVGDLVRWFCDGGREAPYPVGTLLFHTEAQS